MTRDMGVTARYAAIPAETRVNLDWRVGSHWRRKPGMCVRCRNPVGTNCVDDNGEYSHKMCAEIELSEARNLR